MSFSYRSSGCTAHIEKLSSSSIAFCAVYETIPPSRRLPTNMARSQTALTRLSEVCVFTARYDCFTPTVQIKWINRSSAIISNPLLTNYYAEYVVDSLIRNPFFSLILWTAN